MFGYVRPDKSELKGKHLDLYRAYYCGLCRSMKKNASGIYTLSLDYDFVFMSILLDAVCGAVPEFDTFRCTAHPLRKSVFVKDSENLRYTVAASLVLAYHKLCDDINDREGNIFSRLGKRVARGYVSSRLKKISKAVAVEKLEAEASVHLENLNKLESGSSSDIDALCAESGAVIASTFSYPFDGSLSERLYRIGDMLGRFIYTIDACDDLERDEKRGSFNPLLNIYGDSASAKEHFREIDLSLSYYVTEIRSAVSEIDMSDDFRAIIDNITDFGLGKSASRVFFKNTPGDNRKEK